MYQKSFASNGRSLRFLLALALLPHALLALLALTLLTVPALSLAMEPTNKPSEGIPAKKRDSGITVTPTKTGTFGTARTDNKTITLLLGSQSGIGSVELAPQSGAWPEQVTLKIAVKGLEGFELSNGKSTLSISLSSNDLEAAPRQSISGLFPIVPKSGEPEQTKIIHESITPEHQAWATVRRFPPECTRSPDVASVEIDLPADFLTSQSESLTVSWVDFYR